MKITTFFTLFAFVFIGSTVDLSAAARKRSVTPSARDKRAATRAALTSGEKPATTTTTTTAPAAQAPAPAAAPASVATGGASTASNATNPAATIASAPAAAATGGAGISLTSALEACGSAAWGLTKAVAGSAYDKATSPAACKMYLSAAAVAALSYIIKEPAEALDDAGYHKTALLCATAAIAGSAKILWELYKYQTRDA